MVAVGLVTLPGVNTTQFDWNLNKMGAHPSPVAPIYAPEVAARAIVHAATHPRRNTWVGVSTVYTVLGNRITPWFMDVYLGHTGVSSQQTEQDLPHHGPNLFKPRDTNTDRGSNGPFGDQAHHRDPVSALARHRSVTAAASLGLAATVLIAWDSRHAQ